MVGEMSRNDIRQGANREAVVAGDAAARPGFGGHIFKKRNGGEADLAEFFDVGCPGNLVGSGVGGGDILIVAGEGLLEAASEPESAEGEGAFAVGDVVQHLPDAPFVG